MAADKEYNVKVTTDTANAVTGIEKVEAGLKDVGKAADKAGNDMKNAMREARSGVIGIVNDLTGGLASKFMDVKDAIGGATVGLKGFKAALIATGIGALVVALGAIVGYKDELVLMFSDAASETQRFNEEAQKHAEISKEITRSWSLQERQLKALGVEQSRINELKRESIKLALAEARISLENQLAAMDALAAQDERNRSGGIFGALNAALFGANDEDRTKQVDLGMAALNDFKELQTQLLEVTKTINDEQRGEDEKRIVNTTKATETIVRNKIAQVEEIRTIELEAFEASKELGQLAVDENQRQIWEKQKQDQAALDVKKKQDEEYYKLKQAKIQADLAMQTDVINAALALNELFTGKSRKSAERAFKLSKALNIGQAIASTYAAVNAQLADPTGVITGANWVKAGLALAFGLANVKKIMATKFEGGGTSGATSGGGGSFSGGSAGGGFATQSPVAPPPTIQNQQAAQPVQAYVLAGNAMANIDARKKIADQAKL